MQIREILTQREMLYTLFTLLHKFRILRCQHQCLLIRDFREFLCLAYIHVFHVFREKGVTAGLHVLSIISSTVYVMQTSLAAQLE